MEQPTIEQKFHDLRNATSVVQVDRDKASAWFEIADHRHPLPNRFEVVD